MALRFFIFMVRRSGSLDAPSTTVASTPELLSRNQIINAWLQEGRWDDGSDEDVYADLEDFIV